MFRETGDLKKVVDYIIEETEVGLADDGGPGSRWKSRVMNFLPVKPSVN